MSKKGKEMERETIKSILVNFLKRENLKVEKILLFGSRARGDFSKNSDWDLLIILEEKLNIQEKRRISKEIRTLLAKNLIPADIIVKSKEELDYFINFEGSVTKEALKEGIQL